MWKSSRSTCGEESSSGAREAPDCGVGTSEPTAALSDKQQPPLFLVYLVQHINGVSD